jgi:hypothetical protein
MADSENKNNKEELETNEATNKSNDLIPLTIDDITNRTNVILNNLKISRQKNVDLRTLLREEFNDWYEKSMNNLDNRMADYCNENTLKVTDKIKRIDEGLSQIRDLEYQLDNLTKKIAFIYREAQS